MCVSVLVQVPVEARGFDSSGARITGSREPLHMGAVNPAWVVGTEVLFNSEPSPQALQLH